MSDSKPRGSSNASPKSSRSATSSVGNPKMRRSGVREDNTCDKPAKSDNGSTFVPWRIFINHIDSYHGKKLAETFPGRQCVVDGQIEGLGLDAEVGASGETKDKRTIGKRRGKRKSSTADNGDEDDDSEDEGEDEEDEESFSGAKIDNRKFEVVGTVKNDEYERPENVAMVIRPGKNRELLLGELMKCGTVIYDITQDDSQISEALWALEGIVENLENFRREAPKAFELNRDTRHFVLISTVMTWALTKPLNPEDPDLPFTEADYRKRKPHPNFRNHVKCEREVSTVPKRTNLRDKLKTVVIGSGITYGDEEGPIHYLFKMAWHNAEYLPIFGRGNNKIPLLHVRDLVEAVCMLVEKWPKPKYIVAVEQELVSQATIVKKISKALTTGKVKRMASEEAFLLPEITQRTYDMINANINIEPAYVVDNEIPWHWDMPFSDNIDAVIKEYKLSRNLSPVKVVVLGPPASGKTRLARRLAEHYQIHYISVENVIKETIEKLNAEIEAAKLSTGAKQYSDMEAEEVEKDVDDDEEDDEEPARGLEELQAQFDEILNNREENNGRLDDNILNKILLKRLSYNDCQNQGYVMDGYPKTISQAKGLFGSSENDEDVDGDEIDSEDSSVTGGNRKIIPQLVVVLEARDEFLIERVLQLSEKEIQGTHYTEEPMLRRLREYRERNTDDDNPLQFFDELEIHPLVIAIEDDVCPDMFSTFVQCVKRLGEPKNYGPSEAERADAKKRIEAEARATMAIEEARKAREDLERKLAREKKMMEWTDLLEKLTQEEAEQLSIMAEPLRHYLVKYIFPTLSQGLIEVARLRPQDPIDFLAEYLFKENPGGRMFEPDYTETMGMLLSAIEKLQEDILPAGEFDKGMPEWSSTGRGQREAREFSCRERGTNETGSSSSARVDDDAGVGCDGKRPTATIRGERGILSSVVTTMGNMEGLADHAGDGRNGARTASSFSYEDMDDDSSKSFGNSEIPSRENFQ